MNEAVEIKDRISDDESSNNAHEHNYLGYQRIAYLRGPRILYGCSMSM